VAEIPVDSNGAQPQWSSTWGYSYKSLHIASGHLHPYHKGLLVTIVTKLRDGRPGFDFQQNAWNSTSTPPIRLHGLVLS